MIQRKPQNKKYDLEERTLKFAKNCIDLCKLLENNKINFELTSQLIKSSSSIGSNYREANETITKKDFHYRIGICRRESKESNYWLALILHANKQFTEKIEILIDEALQLTRIFVSINKSNKK